MNKATLFLLFFVFTLNLFAQNTERSPLDGTRYGLVYEVSAMKDVKQKANVPYLTDAKGTEVIDIFTPQRAKANDKFPAVIFFNSAGEPPTGKAKDWGVYQTFPRLVATQGMIGISMTVDSTRIQDCLRALFEFIEKEGAKHNIDATRLGIYAASANVTQGAAYLMNETAAKGIKAAVLYYGGVPNMAYRKDLPVLFVVAETDFARNPQQYTGLWQKVSESRAPWTVMFASRMPHAFDAFADNDESRRIIQQTLNFWKTYLEPVPQPSWKPTLAREILAAGYGGNPNKMVELLAQWIAENPKDHVAYHQYGNALMQLQRFDEANTAFEKALELGGTDGGTFLGLGQIRVRQIRFEEAVNYFTKAIENGARFGGAYIQLATAQISLNRFDEAVKTYENAMQRGVLPKATAYYIMACVHSLGKQTDKAFEMLNKAVDEGFTNRQTFETDTDLIPVRSDARFQQILARLPNPNPEKEIPTTATKTSQTKKQFVIVLRLLPKYQDDKNWTETENQAIGRHFARLQQLQKDGKLILAGRTPVKESMGFVIFEVETETEARKIMDDDDAVRAGIMSAEVFPFQTALMKGN